MGTWTLCSLALGRAGGQPEGSVPSAKPHGCSLVSCDGAPHLCKPAAHTESVSPQHPAVIRQRSAKLCQGRALPICTVGPRGHSWSRPVTSLQPPCSLQAGTCHPSPFSSSPGNDASPSHARSSLSSYQSPSLLAPRALKNTLGLVLSTPHPQPVSGVDPD